MSESDNLFALLRRLTGNNEQPVADGDGGEAPRPSPVITPTLAALGAGNPPSAPNLGPLSASIGAAAPNNGPSSLLSRTREAVATSHLPDSTDTLRGQMLALGAGMASSQNRTFGGAFGDGVTAMQRHEGQQAQSQRQLLETEGQTSYREAQIRVQQAQMALAEDPSSPENRARLMQAEAALMAAQARMRGGTGGSGADRIQSGQYIRGEDGAAYIMTRSGTPQPVLINGRPVAYEDVLQVQAQGGRSSVVPNSYHERQDGTIGVLRNDTRGTPESVPVPGLDAIPGQPTRQQRAVLEYAAREQAARNGLDAAAQRRMLIGPAADRFVEQGLAEWRRQYRRPGEPAAPTEPAAPSPNRVRIQMAP